MLFPPTFMLLPPKFARPKPTTHRCQTEPFPGLHSAHFRVQLTSAAETSFSINSRSSSEISAPRSTNLGRMIAKIDGTSAIADSQRVIISHASGIAISAEHRRSDIHTHGMTPPTSVVAVNVTAIPNVATP